MLRTAAALAGLVALVSPAAADQCAWNPKAVAQAASDILSRTKTVQAYCKACGDKAATAVAVKDVQVQPADPGSPDSFVVKLNGEALDLAYTFVPDLETGKQWVNLGLLAKCDEPASFDDQALASSLVSP